MVYSKSEGRKNLPSKQYGKKLGELRHNINRAFDNFFNILDYPLTPLGDFDFIEPKIEMIDGENNVQIQAELPGMKDDDIDIDVSDDGFLTIRGEKHNDFEEKSEGMYFSERSYGMVSRTVALPSDVDMDKIDAKFTNGVLKINLPKTELAKQKIHKIKVKKA